MTAPAENAPEPVHPVSEAEVAPVHVMVVHDPLVRAMVPVPELGSQQQGCPWRWSAPFPRGCHRPSPAGVGPIDEHALDRGGPYST